MTRTKDLTFERLQFLQRSLEIESNLGSGLSKTWIYQRRILAMDYRSPEGLAFSFDVAFTDDDITLDLAPRNDLSRNMIQSACDDLVELNPVTRKFRVGVFSHDIGRAVPEMRGAMRRVHEVLFAANIPEHDVRSGVWASDDIKVNYVWRPAKSDCDHIVVVFTSIRNVSVDLDFDGPQGSYLSTNRAELVFIYDDYAGSYGYYHGKNRRDDFAVAIESFLRNLAERRGVGLDKLILVGMSKGASAAIFIGARLQGSTVAALVPRFSIGDSLSERDAPFHETVAGDRSAESRAWLNALVPSAIRNAKNREGHYYILTSPGDPNCLSGIEEHAYDVAGLRNVNLIVATSRIALRHHDTLQYLLPTTLSLLGVLSSGLRPTFGLCTTKSGGVGSVDFEGPLESMTRWGRARRIRKFITRAKEAWQSTTS